MLAFSTGRLDFMEIKTLKKYSVMSFEFITECFSEDHIPAKAGICYSSLKLSDFVDYLDATDRVPVRSEAVVHIRAATAKVEAVGAVAVRSGRPVVAAAVSIVGIAVVVVAVAGSREKDLRKTLNISIFANKIRAALGVFS